MSCPALRHCKPLLSLTALTGAGTLQKAMPVRSENLVLEALAILDSVAASGKKDGYHFRLLPERTTHNQAIRHYTIEAWPIKRLVKNQRSFFTDETGVIRFTTENRTAKNTDPLLDVPSPRIGNKKTSEMMRTELKWLDLNTTGTAVGVYGVFRGLSAAR